MPEVTVRPPASTDYLVIGSGASGLAFADALVEEEPDVELTLVDRRPGPGGHWLDAYPFVRLHTPSAYYGVNSLPLGEDRIDESGENAGFYERATGAEVRDYFAEVGISPDADRARAHPDRARAPGPGGAWRAAPRPEHRCASRFRGAPQARRRPLSRGLDPGHTPTVLRCCAGCPRRARQRPAGGRAAGDADTPCSGPARPLSTPAPGFWTTTWRRLGSAGFAPGITGFTTAATFSRSISSARTWKESRSMPRRLPRPTGIEDLFDRLEASGRLVRLDPSVPATMYRSTMLSPAEIDAMRADRRCGQARPRPPDRERSDRARRGARPRPAPTCSMSTARLTACGNVPADPDLPEASGSCFSRCGKIRRRSTRRSSPSSRPTAARTPRRTGCARQIPTRAAPTTGPAMSRRTWQVEQRWLREPDVCGLGDEEPAQSSPGPARPCGRATGQDGDRAVPHSRRARHRAAGRAR